MNFCGMDIKTYTPEQLLHARQNFQKIVTGEGGIRMVSYYDKKTNQIVVSHILEEVPND